MAFAPAIVTIGPTAETRFFPVITDTKVINEAKQAGGIEFYLEFRKQRQCDFVGLTWFAEGVRVPVRSELGPGRNSGVWSRPIGEHRAGPWVILGLQSLQRTQAYALHRCHPLWITMTEFYRN